MNKHIELAIKWLESLIIKKPKEKSKSVYGCFLYMENNIPHPDCVLDVEPDEDGVYPYCVEIKKGITDKTNCQYWRKLK